MRKKKFAWLAVSVTLVAVIAIGAYYVFGGKDDQQEKEEQYWWQKDPEIVRVSERFKSIDFEYSDRTMEGVLLFPVITIGSSTTEVKAILGKPDYNSPSSKRGDFRLWAYPLYPDMQAIDFTISDKGIVIDKGVIVTSHNCSGGGPNRGTKND